MCCRKYTPQEERGENIHFTLTQTHMCTGKTSLKKTLFGEPYNPYEKPSTGIHADTSVTRITFKQYREWIQQPTSKADTHRLNLEYIDVIIDFILNFLKQPRVSAPVFFNGILLYSSGSLLHIQVHIQAYRYILVVRTCTCAYFILAATFTIHSI